MAEIIDFAFYRKFRVALPIRVKDSDGELDKVSRKGNRLPGRKRTSPKAYTRRKSDSAKNSGTSQD